MVYGICYNFFSKVVWCNAFSYKVHCICIHVKLVTMIKVKHLSLLIQKTLHLVPF